MTIKNKKVTLKDISTMTGYSISTISKSLKDSNEISVETKKRIRYLSDKLGYIPNKQALSLKFGRSFVIGYVVPSIEDSFYTRIFHGITCSQFSKNVPSHGNICCFE